VAETPVVDSAVVESAVVGSAGQRLRPYRTVLASRARSQRAYRASFAIDLGGSMLVGLVELAEVWVLFSNVTALGGMRFNQILLVFGLADLAFSLADLSFGHLDTLPDYLRAGTLDVFPGSWSPPRAAC
jgi:ABC-2 type transport system permease protein